MLTKPNILVCTDFSSFSDLALEAGKLIQSKTNGNLEVLHVLEQQVRWDWMPNETVSTQYPDTVEKQKFSEIHHRIKCEFEKKHFTAKFNLLSGIPSVAILQEIQDKKIDLIIMGHRGHSGLFSIGSLTQKIVSSSPVPVLVIKEQFTPYRISALVDPNNPMKKILSWAEEMAFLLSTKLSVISLFPDISARFVGMAKVGYSSRILSFDQEEKDEVISNIKQKIRDSLTRHIEAELIVEFSTERKLAFHLNSVLEREKTDLAVMKRHQADFLEKILIGSETRRMLELAKSNLLILPPDEET
jgi:nucleotide-binding universal stress UspA family protein